MEYESPLHKRRRERRSSDRVKPSLSVKIKSVNKSSLEKKMQIASEQTKRTQGFVVK